MLSRFHAWQYVWSGDPAGKPLPCVHHSAGLEYAAAGTGPPLLMHACKGLMQTGPTSAMFASSAALAPASSLNTTKATAGARASST